MLLKSPHLLLVPPPGFVASIAIILTMTLRTAKSEAVGVLLVPKKDFGGWVPLALRLINLEFGFRDRRVHSSDEVIRRGNSLRSLRTCRPRLGTMTNRAARLSTPFPVTAHALTMIRTFQSRFPNVALLGIHFVTGLAGWMFNPLGSEMVANRAPARHLRHFRMTRVVKGHRKVQVFQFVENHDLRATLGGEISFSLRHFRASASAKAHGVDGWIRATVTAIAGHFQLFHRLARTFRGLLAKDRNRAGADKQRDPKDRDNGIAIPANILIGKDRFHALLTCGS